MNYDFTQKNHWRNRIWNLLAERVTVHPRDAVVLYLAAETDFDRPTARRKGFRDENLIAVDRDPKVVAQLRAAGSLAICGDIVNVMCAWPQDKPVQVVIADFCCGLEPAVFYDLPQCMFLRPFVDTCFAVNLLRGRDHRTNDIRLKAARGLGVDSNEHKHRGRLAFYGYYLHHVLYTQDAGVAFTDEDGQRVVDRANPQYGSYKSSAGQYFDWVVFNTPKTRYLGIPQKLIDELADLRRSISAVLAHRTRRLAA